MGDNAIHESLGVSVKNFLGCFEVILRPRVEIAKTPAHQVY
jgi:hypothetical protein